MNTVTNLNLFESKILGESTAIERLENIWRDYYIKSIGENCYSALIQRELKTNAIVFMSINPSLRPKDIPCAQKGYKPTKDFNFFIDSNYEQNDIHYAKFYEIGRKLNSQHWTALDLLYIRNSNQTEVEEITKTELGENFIVEQMRLTFDILFVINPKIVIVSNNGAVKLINSFAKKIGLILELPSVLNGFIYKINNIPFITLESKYLGSQRWCNRDKKEGNKRLNKLISEIERIKLIER